MRRLRAGLCLVLSLLTTALPSVAADIEARPVIDAPLVRLEMPASPVLPETLVLPAAQAPLTSLSETAALAALAPLSAAQTAQAAALSASARPLGVKPLAVSADGQGLHSERPTIAAAQSIATVARSAEKGGVAAQSAEMGRVWNGAKTASADGVDSTPRVSFTRSLLKKARAGAAAAALFAAPRAALAAPAVVAATPAKAMPAGVAHFLHAYGGWVAGGAILAGTWFATQVVSFAVNKISKLAKWEPTTTVAVRLAARIATVTAGVLVGMHAAGVPTDALVTTFGLGGVGVTMAVKDFVGNTIEGAKVLVNQPFVIGDKIKIGDRTFTVVGMDLYYVKLQRDDLQESPTFKPYAELAGSSIKIFRPYSANHKTRLFHNVSIGGVLRRAFGAPALMWQATKDMPKPNLKRSSLWLAGGLGLLFGIPQLERLVIGLLPKHLGSMAPGLGLASAVLASAGVAFIAYKLAKFVKKTVDGWAEKRGWSKLVKGAVGAGAFAAVAALGIAAVYFGLPIAKSLVAVSLASNIPSVAAFLHTAFTWVQAAAIIAATRSALNWLNGFIDHLAGKFGWNPQMVLALKLGVEALSYVVGGALALRQVGMTWSSLLKTLGATSAALGWAASDVLGNLISGVWLLWRKPFRVHDWLEVDGYVGQVVDMTVQYVVLSQDDGSHVLVPQGVMKKGFTPLRTPADVARAKAARQAIVDQADYLADLYKKSQAK